jgi:hypothetical protein
VGENPSAKGCAGWFCYGVVRGCFLLSIRKQRQVVEYAVLVKTARRAVAYHRMTNLLNNYLFSIFLIFFRIRSCQKFESL